jgi:hypothetical protein
LQIRVNPDKNVKTVTMVTNSVDPWILYIPQGGSTLNGDSLKAEAQAELEKLELQVSTAVSGGTGYGFIIG